MKFNPAVYLVTTIYKIDPPVIRTIITFPLACPHSSGIGLSLENLFMNLNKRFERKGTLYLKISVFNPIGPAAFLFFINALRTGLLNCLNARSRGLTFRHRASFI